MRSERAWNDNREEKNGEREKQIILVAVDLSY